MDDHRVAEAQAEQGGGVDARIQARDHKRAPMGNTTAPRRPRRRLRSSAGSMLAGVIAVLAPARTRRVVATRRMAGFADNPPGSPPSSPDDPAASRPAASRRFRAPRPHDE